jgi:hypothetical protein
MKGFTYRRGESARWLMTDVQTNIRKEKRRTVRTTNIAFKSFLERVRDLWQKKRRLSRKRRNFCEIYGKFTNPSQEFLPVICLKPIPHAKNNTP